MNALRRGLTLSNGTTTAARNAASAVANRVPASGLEVNDRSSIQAEEWIAADVEDVDVAVFSEPLTIDELNDVRSSLESALAQSQDGPQLAPAGHDGTGLPETDTSSESRLSDPDYQMQVLDTRAHVALQPGVKEFLDAAVIAAQNEAVKNTVISVIFNSPEARASLERAFAKNGLAVNLTQHSQGQISLPPAAGPLQAHSVQVTDITDAEEPREGQLGNPLEGLIDAITSTLGNLGHNVRIILRKFVARWKHHFDSVFNPGALADEEADGQHPRVSSRVIDALTASATLLIVLAVVRRVPGMR